MRDGGLISLIMQDQRKHGTARRCEIVGGGVFVTLALRQEENAGRRRWSGDTAFKREISAATRQERPKARQPERRGRIRGKVKIGARNPLKRDEGVGPYSGGIIGRRVC